MIFGREPALILRAVSAVVALVVAAGLPLTENAAQALIALTAAVLGAWQALSVRPVAPSVFGAVIAAGIALLAALDVVHVTDMQTALTVAGVEAVLALWLRPQSTPVSAPGDKQATVG